MKKINKIKNVLRLLEASISTNQEEGKNGYIAFYNGKKIEVYANSSYEAQQKALKTFQSQSRKKIQGWEINVTIATKDGEDVIHSTSEF